MQLIAKTFQELTTTELYEILKARAEIFIMEQKINYQDMDDIDYQSLHCFFMEDNKVIAYLRAFYEDQDQGIVRMGRVLTLQHGKGVGKYLLEESITAIKDRMNCQKIVGHAQKYALGFYEKLGFKAVTDDFIEEGIVHIGVELEL